LVQPESDTLEFPLLTLLNNVDKLTQPYQDRIEQDEGGHRTTVTIRRPALLDQLEEAIFSSQTLSKRGSTLASQRNVLDASAFMLRQAITTSMSMLWTRYNEDRMPTDLKQALRLWQTRFRKLAQDRNLNPDTIWKVVRQTNAWINAIELKFDPPITLEMTRPCPKCEHQHVYNEHNERVAAVIITWQKSFDKSLAQCRACGQTWLGESELRQLRYDVDQKDTLWGIG
jgi:hypothetical protein